MREIVIVAVLVGLSPLFAVGATAANDKATAVLKKERPYPGGRDEEDIKVQETLVSPSTKVDRHSIEAKILKNYFNKLEQEIKTDSQSESESESQ